MLVNKKKYHVNDDEFKKIYHEEYNNLKILDSLSEYERVISLINEIGKNLSLHVCIFEKPTHGGFIPIHCSRHFGKIYLLNIQEEHKENIKKNIKYHMVYNIFSLNENTDAQLTKEQSILFYKNATDIDYNFVEFFLPIVITKTEAKTFEIFKKLYYQTNIYHLSNSEYYIFIPPSLGKKFNDSFLFFITISTKVESQELYKELNYDNLLHLCIMVKNGGPQFESMLQENKKYIDRWTILDTGSTDGTIETIKKVLVDKKGELYEEPFINFRDSRNRCLELAGKKCKFTVMLDDTYIINSGLRLFLNTVRGDQYADSFSIFIHSGDSEYASNRILKTESELRYNYRVHEVITEKNNTNVIIPNKDSFIEDRRYDYMENRTKERKQNDLQLLFEELEENVMEPRTYYYLGQTYYALGDMEKAYYYYLKRAEIVNAGFIQERIDALFEAARIANFQLKKEWKECLNLYECAYKADESRPESLYFIGLHYYLQSNMKLALPYLKKAFEIGFPRHCQYGLKPTLSFHFLPKILARISYHLNEYELGESACRLFLRMNKQNDNDYNEVVSWNNIYTKLNKYKGECVPKKTIKPLFVFVADGGFEPWTGSDILTKGVGGSETYIIEMARYIQKNGIYQVIVFCNCLQEVWFEDVLYKPLDQYYEFVNTQKIDHCIISRFSEYLPVTFKGWTENVYLVVHDLTPSGIVIPLDKKLKQVFCLTEWHVEYFTNIFPELKNITVPFYYGIDFEKFHTRRRNDSQEEDESEGEETYKKEKHKFIYSSFPNRGLLILLQMWPSIIEIQPKASLHIFCDVDGKWVNNVAKDQIQIIKQLLNHYKNNPDYHVNYHGWVNKQTLADAWLSADIWFYPCTFKETFCLTALEAALTRTFIISNDLAALKNTVGDRGIIVPGDPYTKEWKEKALEKIASIVQPSNIDEMITTIKNPLIERNYKWAMNLSWKNQAENLMTKYILPQSKIQYKGFYSNIHETNYMRYTFACVVDYFNNDYKKEGVFEPIRILEIGTYTGNTLIQLLHLIKHSIGVGLDIWENNKISKNKIYKYIEENDVEKVFYKNVYNAGMMKRAKGMKGDSAKILTSMIKQKELYDLIYLDGSEEENDFYSDLLLSWQIVNKGGYLITSRGNRKEVIIGKFINKFYKEIEYKSVNEFVFLFKKLQ